MTALRVTTRVVAFVRIAILARIFSPQQFGLFGIATLVLTFLEIFFETGVNVFFIQEEGKLDEYISTAWIVSILRGAVISLLLLASSPLIALFFKAPDVLPLILLTSIVPFLRGFINPAIVTFQKELFFAKEFLLRFSIFFLDSLVVVAFGWLTKSVSSLIYGIIAGAVLEIILSYTLINLRPKLSFELEKAKKIINRGRWMTAAGIFDYLFENLDDIVVGRLLNINFLGLYQMAYKISSMPISEITDVFGKVTFPIYVKISGDKLRLKRAYLRTVLGISLMVLILGAFLFIFSKQVVGLVLGEKWLEIVPVLKILTIYGIIKAISNTANPIFLAVKKQEYITAVTFVGTLILAIFIVPMVSNFQIIGAGFSAVIGSIITVPIIFYFLRKTLKD